MQALVRRQPLFDLRVTSGATQFVFAAAADMAISARRRSTEFGMRLRKCAGRKLRERQDREEADHCQQLRQHISPIVSTRRVDHLEG